MKSCTTASKREISTTEGYSLKSTSCSSSQQPCTPCVFPSAALPFLQPVVGSGQRHLRSADHQVLPLLLRPPAKFKLRCRRRCVKRCQIRLDQSRPGWSCVGWSATGSKPPGELLIGQTGANYVAGWSIWLVLLVYIKVYHGHETSLERFTQQVTTIVPENYLPLVRMKNLRRS